MTFTDNHFKILTRLADDCFHSGSKLSAELGLSRSAIWKYCQSFSELGLEVNAVRGKGYRLNRSLDLLSAPQIKKNLTPAVLSSLSALDIYPQISSTNDYLLDAMKLSPQSGHVCFAESQTKGRGRRGRDWVSPFGSNIYLSLSWVFQQGFSSLSGLSLAIGVAIIRALTELGVDNMGLKWPNDIYWHDKKLGGILIEISGESSGECTAIIGLGLNLYLPEKETGLITQPWVDLEKIMPSMRYSRNGLSALLLNHLLPIVTDFETKTFKHYLTEWRDYDCMRGREVTIYRGKQQFEGTIVGIDDTGMLLLKELSGLITPFASGEVSFRQT
ncbi:MAG: bifunctional biotin--[acetyl-CoA-carboxylase] ligase/biotin operon repressor BirA [Methylococcales bacterium]|nr:bifunctional biotin--[acetyl-CoA-carboxylase] ligase/biotin operon repressor BirA [Methylococcales bacterium]